MLGGKMERAKKVIEIKDIPALFSQCKTAIKAGIQTTEFLTCVFQYKDDPVIYMYSVFDWIDLPQDKEYISFSLYQMVKN